MNDTPQNAPANAELSVTQILAELVRRWWLILGLTMLTGIVAAAYAWRLDNVYESSAGLIIREPLSAIGDKPAGQELNVETLRSLADSTDVKWQLFELLWEEKALAHWREEGVEKDNAFAGFQDSLMTDVQQRDARGDNGAGLLPLLLIKTWAGTPDEARLVANRWANIIVDEVRSIYTEGVEDLNQFISGMYATADEKLRLGETLLAEQELEADLDVKKSSFDKARSEAMKLDADVFDLRVTILTKQTLLEQMKQRVSERQQDGVWLADLAEDVYAGDPDAQLIDENTPREAREILSRVKLIVDKEYALQEFVTESGLNAKESESETLLEELAKANRQLSEQRLELTQRLREQENIEELLSEQEVDGRWVGQVLDEYYRELYAAKFGGASEEEIAAIERPQLPGPATRVDRLVSLVVERELSLFTYEQDNDIEFKQTQLAELESEVQALLKDRANAQQKLALTSEQLEVLTPLLETEPPKLTLDKAITNDVLWQQYIEGGKQDKLAVPLKTEMLNPTHQHLQTLVVDLKVQRESQNAQIRYLNEREMELRSEIEGLREEIQLINLEIKGREQGLSALREALLILATKYSDYKKRMERLIVENREAEQAIEALEEGRDEIYKRHRDLKEEISRIELRIAAKQGDIDNLRTDLKELEADYREERSQLQALRLELVRLEYEKALKEDVLAESTAESEELQTEIARIEQDLQIQEREVARLTRVQSSLSTRAEEISLLQITAENASQTGTAILFNAQANPLPVAPRRVRIVLFAAIAAFMVCSVLIAMVYSVREAL